MSFLERARAGYESLAGRADQAFDSATASKELGDIDQHYRDLGLLAYLAATGRPADEATRQRLVSVLHSLEDRGAIRDFVLATTGRAPGGVAAPPPRHGGSDGIPEPPPERAGRHGDFLSQPRGSSPAPSVPPPPPAPAPEETWSRSDPDEATGPRPSTPPPPPPGVGGTWGPPPR